MTEVEFQERIALYALGSLEPNEAARVELYLKNNPTAHATYLWYLESVAVLAQAVPSQTPNPSIKAALKKRIRALNQQKLSFLPMHWFGGFGRKLEFARLLLLGLLVAVIGLLFGTDQQQQTIASLHLEMRNIEQLLGSQQTLSFLLQAPGSSAVVGKVFVSQEKKLLLSHSMGILPKQKTWQAWYFKAGVAKPISLGTTSKAHLMIRLPDGATAVAVSEEPVGGSVQPTVVRGIAQLSL